MRKQTFICCDGEISEPRSLSAVPLTYKPYKGAPIYGSKRPLSWVGWVGLGWVRFGSVLPRIVSVGSRHRYQTIGMVRFLEVHIGMDRLDFGPTHNCSTKQNVSARSNNPTSRNPTARYGSQPKRTELNRRQEPTVNVIP